MIKLSLFLSLLIFVSCAGYRVKKNDNPFKSYGIQSVAIPMFVNRSSIPNVSAPMTKEINLLLSESNKLRIYAGEDSRADAVLIGIIDSEARRSDVFETSAVTFTSGALAESIGDRNEFFIPISVLYNLRLQLVLIKKPSKEDLNLIHSSWGTHLNKHPKIIFNETFNFTQGVSRIVSETTSVDSGGVVNFTKNKAFFDESIEQLAINAAQNFREVVLDAF